MKGPVVHGSQVSGTLFLFAALASLEQVLSSESLRESSQNGEEKPQAAA